MVHNFIRINAGFVTLSRNNLTTCSYRQ